MAKTNAKSAKESKNSKANVTHSVADRSERSSEKNTTRKGATKGEVKSAAAKQAKNAGKTKGVIKNAQMTVEDVVASVRLNTKGKLKDLEMRKGVLYRGGEQMLEFTEMGLSKQTTHPWEVRQKLAEEKPYARISANSNGGFLGVYVPRENFQNNREFLEALLDTTELLVEKMDGVDTIGVIDHLRALKRKILEAYV